jgi:hypothetical protein
LFAGDIFLRNLLELIAPYAGFHCAWIELSQSPQTELMKVSSD